MNCAIEFSIGEGMLGGRGRTIVAMWSILERAKTLTTAFSSNVRLSCVQENTSLGILKNFLVFQHKLPFSVILDMHAQYFRFFRFSASLEIVWKS